MDLDAFTSAYIECALWSSTDNAREGGGDPLDETYGLDDLAPETLAALVEDCRVFQAAHADHIDDNDAQAGHDFWLTRNGHGAGFWDGDWPEPAATILTEASRACGTVDLYVGDDGRLYYC